MYKLFMENASEPNWEFTDEYENFDGLINRVSKTLKGHENEIKLVSIYNLKAFKIRIINLDEKPNTEKVVNEK